MKKGIIEHLFRGVVSMVMGKKLVEESENIPEPKKKPQQYVTQPAKKFHPIVRRWNRKHAKGAFGGRFARKPGRADLSFSTEHIKSLKLNRSQRLLKGDAQ